MSERKGDWICTYTGIKFWPLDPRPEEICIEDIAHSLSLQCRFGGHTREFHSVGDHSLLVSSFCDDRLWGLLHDSPEAYLIDLPRPIKRFSLLGYEYRKIEDRLMAVIAERFGLKGEMPQHVHDADDYVLAWEVRDLMPPAAFKVSEDVAASGAALPKNKLKPRSADWVERYFLERFATLHRA